VILTPRDRIPRDTWAGLELGDSEAMTRRRRPATQTAIEPPDDGIRAGLACRGRRSPQTQPPPIHLHFRGQYRTPLASLTRALPAIPANPFTVHVLCKAGTASRGLLPTHHTSLVNKIASHPAVTLAFNRACPTPPANMLGANPTPLTAYHCRGNALRGAVPLDSVRHHL